MESIYTMSQAEYEQANQAEMDSNIFPSVSASNQQELSQHLRRHGSRYDPFEFFDNREKNEGLKAQRLEVAKLEFKFEEIKRELGVGKLKLLDVEYDALCATQSKMEQKERAMLKLWEEAMRSETAEELMGDMRQIVSLQGEVNGLNEEIKEYSTGQDDTHFDEKELKNCHVCGERLVGKCMEDRGGKRYHYECFNCLVCDKRLADEEGNYPYWTYGDGVFCSECGMEQLKRWREVQNVTLTETDDSDRNIRA